MVLPGASIVLTFEQPEHFVPHAVQDIDRYLGRALHRKLRLQVDACSILDTLLQLPPFDARDVDLEGATDAQELGDGSRCSCGGRGFGVRS